MLGLSYIMNMNKLCIISILRSESTDGTMMSKKAGPAQPVEYVIPKFDFDKVEEEEKIVDIDGVRNILNMFAKAVVLFMTFHVRSGLEC